MESWPKTASGSQDDKMGVLRSFLKRVIRLNVLTGTRFFEKRDPAQVSERLLRDLKAGCTYMLFNPASIVKATRAGHARHPIQRARINEWERRFWMLHEESKYLDFYLYTTKHSVYTTYCIASSAFEL